MIDGCVGYTPACNAGLLGYQDLTDLDEDTALIANAAQYQLVLRFYEQGYINEAVLIDYFKTSFAEISEQELKEYLVIFEWHKNEYLRKNSTEVIKVSAEAIDVGSAAPEFSEGN